MRRFLASAVSAVLACLTVALPAAVPVFLPTPARAASQPCGFIAGQGVLNFLPFPSTGGPPTPGTPVTTSGTGTSVAFTGLSTAAPQTIAIALEGGTLPTVSPPSNFTLVQQPSNLGNGETVAVYRATTSLVANPSFGLSISTPYAGIAIPMTSDSGLDGTGSSQQSSNTSGATETAPSVTPSQANDYLLAFYTRNDTNSVATGPAGLTSLGSAGVSGTSAVQAWGLSNPALSAQTPGLVWTSTGFYAGANAYVLLEGSTSGGGSLSSCVAAGGGGACSSANYLSIVNGSSWPLDFCAYSGYPPWTQTLPASPSQLDATNTTYLRNGALSGSVNYYTAGDGPVYLAASGDPSVTISSCSPYGWNIGSPPSSIQIPTSARPQTGSDHHLGVIEQNGNEYDFWEATYTGGSSMSAQICIETPITGSGFPAGFSTTSGSALANGVITGNDLNAGAINHGLILNLGCTTGYEFPGTSNAYECSNVGQTGPPVGATVWVDYTPSQVAALSSGTCDAFCKMVLNALHAYGGVINDTGAYGSSFTTPMGIIFEDPEQYRAYGQTPPVTTWAIAQGWSNGGTDVYTDPNAANYSAMASHFHVLATCYMYQTGNPSYCSPP